MENQKDFTFYDMLQMLKSLCPQVKDEATKTTLTIIEGILTRMYIDLNNAFNETQKAQIQTSIAADTAIRLSIEKELFTEEEAFDKAKELFGEYEHKSKEAFEETKQPESDASE